MELKFIDGVSRNFFFLLAFSMTRRDLYSFWFYRQNIPVWLWLMSGVMTGDSDVRWHGVMTRSNDRVMTGVICGDMGHGNMQHWHCFLNARISWLHWTGNIWSLPTVLLLQCLARGDAEAGEAGEVWCESDTVHTEGRGASSQPRDKCLMESFTSRDARSGGILKLLLLS